MLCVWQYSMDGLNQTEQGLMDCIYRGMRVGLDVYWKGIGWFIVLVLREVRGVEYLEHRHFGIYIY